MLQNNTNNEDVDPVFEYAKFLEEIDRFQKIRPNFLFDLYSFRLVCHPNLTPFQFFYLIQKANCDGHIKLIRMDGIECFIVKED